MWPEEEVAEILESACAERLIEVCGLPLVTLRIAQMPLGHVSAAAALRAADRLSSAARAERVVLLATASYRDPLALRLLADEHRLKSPESPTGLIPGEAGAAVLLEAGGVTSSARGAHAQVLSAVAGEDSVDFGDDNVAVARRTAAAQVGQRLASVVERALDEAGCETFTGTVFVDLNGEEWKSVAWGVALTRLTSRLAPDDCVVDYPCVSFGEIGAAGAVAAICLASRAFLGGYATGDLALILAIGDAGRVSAIVLQRLA